MPCRIAARAPSPCRVGIRPTPPCRWHQRAEPSRVDRHKAGTIDGRASRHLREQLTNRRWSHLLPHMSVDISRHGSTLVGRSSGRCDRAPSTDRPRHLAGPPNARLATGGRPRRRSRFPTPGARTRCSRRLRLRRRVRHRARRRCGCVRAALVRPPSAAPPHRDVSSEIMSLRMSFVDAAMVS